MRTVHDKLAVAYGGKSRISIRSRQGERPGTALEYIPSGSGDEAGVSGRAVAIQDQRASASAAQIHHAGAGQGADPIANLIQIQQPRSRDRDIGNSGDLGNANNFDHIAERTTKAIADEQIMRDGPVSYRLTQQVRAGVNERAAGVGIGCRTAEDQRARAGLGDIASAADRTGDVQKISREYRGECGVTGKRDDAIPRIGTKETAQRAEAGLAGARQRQRLARHVHAIAQSEDRPGVDHCARGGGAEREGIVHFKKSVIHRREARKAVRGCEAEFADAILGNASHAADRRVDLQVRGVVVADRVKNASGTEGDLAVNDCHAIGV